MKQQQQNWKLLFKQAQKRAQIENQIKRQDVINNDKRKFKQCLAILPKQNLIKICSQGHRLCLKCLIKVNQVYSQCPQCNQVFDISEIQQKMRKKRSFCLYSHYQRNKLPQFLKEYCSNCGILKFLQYQWGVCKFKICNPCIIRWCDKFCQREKLYIPDNLKSKKIYKKIVYVQQSCCKCNKEFIVGQKCEYCSISIFFDCSNPSSKIV